jgi:hypothetical protein
MMGKTAAGGSPQRATVIHGANSHSDFDRFFVCQKGKGYLDQLHNHHLIKKDPKLAISPDAYNKKDSPVDL